MNSKLVNSVFARILVLLKNTVAIGNKRNIYNIRLNCAERVCLIVNNNNGCASQKTNNTVLCSIQVSNAQTCYIHCASVVPPCA